MQILSASIDLAKIDKSRIKEGKNGQKYYDVSIIVSDEEDNYGNTVAVIENQTKEEREAKANRNYLGNGKVVFTKEPAGAAPKKAPAKAAKSGYDDDLGF